MKACIVQNKPKQNISDNLNRILFYAKKAHQKKCDLVVFPELFLTGYSIFEKINQVALTISNPIIKKICDYSKQLNIIIAFGFVRKDDANNYYNSVCVSDKNGEIAGFYDKTHLFDSESNYFVAGKTIEPMKTSIGLLGFMICYDLEFPEVARVLSQKHADYLCCISANMFPYKKLHTKFAWARAVENYCPLIYVNYVGKDKNFHYCGQSNFFSKTGKKQNRSSYYKSKLLMYDFAKNNVIYDKNMDYLLYLQNSK